MKILQVTPCFYPAWAYGGPVPVAYNLSRELVKRGHQVVVYTTDTIDGKTRQKIRSVEVEGIKVFYFRNISNSLAWKRYFLSPGMIFRFQKEIESFDVIHVHGLRDFPAILAHYYARKHSIPYILQAHGSVATLFQKGMLKKIFDRLWGYNIVKDASTVIAITPLEARQYESLGINESSIKIIPHGIDPSEFDNCQQRGEFRGKHKLPSNQKIILYLGRINQIKGLDLLVETFASSLKDLDNAKLVIAGPDDGYLPQLKKLVRKLKIEEDVLFTGPLYGKDKLEAYVDADVYVLPSSYEIFGITALEACACGTPVIVTDACGIANILDGRGGIAVPYDREKLHTAIMNIMTDDKLRQELSKMGKLLVGDYLTWSRIAEQFEKIYNDVLKAIS